MLKNEDFSNNSCTEWIENIKFASEILCIVPK